jgi:hypothetical protein
MFVTNCKVFDRQIKLAEGALSSDLICADAINKLAYEVANWCAKSHFYCQ